MTAELLGLVFLTTHSECVVRNTRPNTNSYFIIDGSSI